jgi:hypothetical protein
MEQNLRHNMVHGAQHLRMHTQDVVYEMFIPGPETTLDMRYIK